MEPTLKDFFSVLSDEQKAQLNKIQEAKYAWAREEQKKYDESRYVIFWTLCKIILYYLLPCSLVLLVGVAKNEKFVPFLLVAVGTICICGVLAVWAIVTPY